MTGQETMRVALGAGLLALAGGAVAAVAPERVRPVCPRAAAIEARAAVAEARRDMAAQCAAKGVTMPDDADFGALALCGRDIDAEVQAALVEVRASIAAAKGLSDADRRAALSGVERALSRLDRRGAPEMH